MASYDGPEGGLPPVGYGKGCDKDPDDEDLEDFDSDETDEEGAEDVDDEEKGKKDHAPPPPPNARVEYTFYPHHWARHTKTIGTAPDTEATKFLWDGDNTVAEYLTNDTVTDQNTMTFVTPFLDQNLAMKIPGSLPNAGTYYYVQDGLGSVRNLLDSAQAVKNVYDHEAFGQAFHTGTVETVAQPFAFTGRRTDVTIGQYNYRNRQYCSMAGAFTARDPLCPLAHLPAAAALHFFQSGEEAAPPSLVHALGMRFHLAALLDGYSRRLLAARVYARTPTAMMMAAFVKRTAAATGMPPSIVTDHGPQFRDAFESRVSGEKTAVVRCCVHSFKLNGKLERWFLTFKTWARLKLFAWFQDRKRIARWIERRALVFKDWYNTARPNQALGGLTPDEAWAGASLPEPIVVTAHDAQPTFDVSRAKYQGDPQLPVFRVDVEWPEVHPPAVWRAA